MLGIFRILIGFMFALHGSAKVLGWPATSVGKIPVGNWPYWYAGLIELIIGVLLILGVFSRLAPGRPRRDGLRLLHRAPAQGLLPIENGGELAVLYAPCVPGDRLRRRGSVRAAKHRAG